VPANGAEHGEKTVTFGNTSPQQQAMPFWPPSATDHGRRCDDINRLTDWAGIEKTYLKVRGRWCSLYRAIDRNGDLIDTMLSEHRGMAAAKAFFRSAKSAIGMTPDPTLGRHVKHRTSAYGNNGLEQDHRGAKGRIRCMRGFKTLTSAERFCRGYDELRAFLRLCTRHRQHVPTNRRRLLHLRRATAVLAILEAA
jgi:putative transposase